MLPNVDLNKGRRTTAHRLAPLGRLHLNSRSAGPKERDRALLTLLRTTARVASWREPCPFYSIRNVASHFRISPTAVTRIFDQLKAEGILRGSWGSKTTVEPVHLDRQLRMRGVVAVFVQLDFFSRDDEYRLLMADLTHQLWELKFVSRVWFYKPTGRERLDVCEGMIKEQPDAIVWFRAASRDMMLERRLVDCGARVVSITEASLRSIDPPCVQRALAIAKDLAA